MKQSDRHEVAYAVTELEDARDELEGVVLPSLQAARSMPRAMKEKLEVSSQAVGDALGLLVDVMARLEGQIADEPGLPVSKAAAYLSVSEPTIRAWLTRELLERVDGSKPVLVRIDSLRVLARALAELRQRGRERDWTQALVDYLHDHHGRTRPEVERGLEELRRGNLEPA